MDAGQPRSAGAGVISWAVAQRLAVILVQAREYEQMLAEIEAGRT